MQQDTVYTGFEKGECCHSDKVFFREGIVVKESACYPGLPAPIKHLAHHEAKNTTYETLNC